jgi:hypothetical protein
VHLAAVNEMSFPLCTTPLKKPGQVLLHQEFWVADRTRIFLTVLATFQAIRDTFLHLTVTLLKKKQTSAHLSIPQT